MPKYSGFNVAIAHEQGEGAAEHLGADQDGGADRR